MAATDKPFNNQRTLDIVFGVSNILMLLSVGWMMAQDHYREYKVEQRAFRDVESSLAIRMALAQLPEKTEIDAAEKAVKDARQFRQDNESTLNEARAELARLKPRKEKAEVEFQSANAEVDSITSFLSIALEHRDNKLAEQYRKQLEALNESRAKAQAKRDGIVSQIKAEQQKVEDIEGRYTKAAAAYKKINDKLDGQVKLALAKRWQISDWMRTLPVIDGFASPLRIHQFVIEDIPIDYNFKKVTRFDRCMTCHVGIDRPAYTRANLESLTQDPSDAETKKLDAARKLYEDRVKAVDPKDAATIPDPNRIQLSTLPKSLLTPSRIAEFAVHPRIDLFVGSNSKHPAEKFGCTSCHSGQGSGTSFGDSSHSPNDSKKREAWIHDRGWEHNHMWDFPMLPTRFVESSCLKCHHEVTDLISTDNRVEAPKLIRGYNLIKENGCFGCHEIDGWKGPNRVGPDLRLEPSPPLEDLTPIERDRAIKDPDNRPGSMRKVGPSLARVSEKVSQTWMEKWIRSPSSFRPDTKMPHYYGLSTNDVSVLKATAPDHEKDVVERFPNTEIASIAHFLTRTSQNYLKDAEKYRGDNGARKDEDRLTELLALGRLEKKEQDEFNDLKWRIRLRKEAPLKELAKGHKPDVQNGRVLFTEKGCLSCHTHHGTETSQNSDKPELVSPGVHSNAVFGPNLIQLKEKLGNSDKAKQWLIQWILNPQLHNPRSRMPIVRMSNSGTAHDEEKGAADLAEWLLSQPGGDFLGEDWNKIAVTPPSKKDMHDLARVYLVRMMSKSDIEKYLSGKMTKTELDLIRSDIPNDEYELASQKKTDDEDALKMYLGKKAVTRLGCFGCHDIPGFEKTKNIGVGLNDWGKKDPSRLAFEDIGNFYRKHYYTVNSLVDKDGKPHSTKNVDGDDLKPYEAFYTEALIGHFPTRDGYLNQKIRDPRSYDFNRIRAWDDRARMPKFTFARPRMKADEKPADFKARSFKDEAEARESVATFVLGLVAEPVPQKSINRPTGDRLAEVKGRQILDKYNCNGCHIIRPGAFDFKPGPKTLDNLEFLFKREQGNMADEFILANHHNWVGRNPIDSDKLTAFGTQAVLQDPDVLIRLAEGLRFRGKDGTTKSLPAGIQAIIAADEMGAIKSQADLDRLFAPSAPYGGTFTDLMVPYLSRKDKDRYPLVNDDSASARAALPPMLIGQGERTQPDWLYQFLLNPQQVRRMTILRMPKFNLDKDEAKTLADYFAGVTRQTNPGIGLVYPYESLASREDFSGEYWRSKTAAYVAYLKNNNERDKEGKETKKSLYDARIAAYAPLWAQIRSENQPILEKSLNRVNDTIKEKTTEKEAKEKALLTAKDPMKETLTKEIESLKFSLAAAAEEKSNLTKSLRELEVKDQQKNWEEREAYAADAYRMLMSRDLCTKCHQIGATPAGEQVKQGPALDQVSMRLRPDWIERWVNKPQRFVPDSLMTPYFKKHELQYQALFAGPASEQIPALRDVLLNYPRIAALPVNRLHSPDRPAGK